MDNHKIKISEETLKQRLNEIASKLGTSVSELLEQYGDAITVVERFDSGDLMLLSEEDESCNSTL